MIYIYKRGGGKLNKTIIPQKMLILYRLLRETGGTVSNHLVIIYSFVLQTKFQKL